MKSLFFGLLLIGFSAQADMIAFKCDYGKSGEVIAAEEVGKDQKSLTKTYYYEDNFTVKVTIFDLTNQNSSGIVKEVVEGKSKEMPAKCFFIRK
jgi:hypothetical protein